METLSIWCGCIAASLLLFGVLYCIKDFSGMNHEPFSLLNHFISELGDPRFAKHYRFFAFTLITSGFLMLPFIIGLSLQINSVLGIVLLIFGIFGAISCSLIGIVSEDKIKFHFIIAGFFFIGMALLILLVIIVGFMQPIVILPLWFLFSSIGLFGTFTSFIIDTATLDKAELKLTDEPWKYDPRPRFWRNPFLEWVAFFSIILWLYLLIVANL
jgi:predicted MFS family arabinose efflux permease